MFKKKKDGDFDVKPQKEKKEKKPLDGAAKKKRRKIIAFGLAGVIVLLVVVQNVFGKNEVQTFVSTAEAVTGEIEQVINTSGTVTTEKNQKLFFRCQCEDRQCPGSRGGRGKGRRSADFL